MRRWFQYTASNPMVPVPITKQPKHSSGGRERSTVDFDSSARTMLTVIERGQSCRNSLDSISKDEVSDFLIANNLPAVSLVTPSHRQISIGRHSLFSNHLHCICDTMSFNRLPLTKKVGEVAEGEEKFQSWSGTHGYYTRPATVSNPFKTDKMLSGTFDKDEMINNVSLCTTLRELNKSQVEFKPRTGNDAKMLGTSSSMSYFVDQKLLSHIIQEHGTEENFRTSFDKIYDSLPESGPERSKYYSIPVKRVRDVVNDCMGLESPEFIVNKFIELSNYHSAGGRKSYHPDKRASHLQF